MPTDCHSIMNIHKYSEIIFFLVLQIFWRFEERCIDLYIIFLKIIISDIKLKNQNIC